MTGRDAIARHDIFAGLQQILIDMVDDEEAGTSDGDVVVLVRQRLQALIVQIDALLQGVN